MTTVFSKIKKCGLGLSMVLMGGFLVGSVNRCEAQTTVTISPSTVYCTFEGWGTSLAWWANTMGGWSTANRNALLDSIFGTKGIQFNIVRYNIGAGIAPGQNYGTPARMMPCFKANATAPYDWTQDSNQIAILSGAKERAGAQFLSDAFANSPPWWLCVNGSSHGNGCNQVITSANYNAYADYLTEVVKHFRDSLGITFTYLEAFNEPYVCWGPNSGQEGAYLPGSQEVGIVNSVQSYLNSKGLSGTVVTANDMDRSDNTSWWTSYDTAAKAAVKKINVHGYYIFGNGPTTTAAYDLAKANGKKIWQSESDETTPVMLARNVTKTFRWMHPSAWILWQTLDPSSGWGFFSYSATGQTFSPTAKFFAMQQFSRFIRPGYQIISNNLDTTTLAAYDPVSKTAVIVVGNISSSSVNYTFNLSAFLTVAATALTYRTSGSENMAHLPDVAISNKVLSVTVNATSVQTFVIAASSTGILRSVFDNPTPKNPVPSNLGLSLSMHGSVIKIPENAIGMEIYSLQGKKLFQFRFDEAQAQRSFTMPKSVNSSEVYCVKFLE
jgi:O-glycosyl hydrolase